MFLSTLRLAAEVVSGSTGTGWIDTLYTGVGIAVAAGAGWWAKRRKTSGESGEQIKAGSELPYTVQQWRQALDDAQVDARSSQQDARDARDESRRLRAELDAERLSGQRWLLAYGQARRALVDLQTGVLEKRYPPWPLDPPDGMDKVPR